MAPWSPIKPHGGSLLFLGEPEAELVTLQQLRCFLAAVHAGSFTGAATILDVSQPAVAEQVRNLERVLRIELFVRAGRGVRLSPAGRAFAERAPSVMAALEAAVQSVSEVRAVHRGTVAFGLFSTPEAYRLDEFVAAFARDHPGVSLALVGRNSSVAADRVRQGELEAGLVTLPLDDDGLDVRPFVRDEVVYVSADPDRVREEATIERLSERPLILYDAASGDRDPLRRQVQERAQQLGFRLKARVETETMVMALRLVAAGLGDTYVPRAHTFASYFPSRLGSVSFRPALHETFAIVTRRGGRASPATKLLVEGIEAHMRSLDFGLEEI